ncbi:VOC family protein [Variovorax terrae]|uniref:Glyoxalase n=1 Tax=Variovorax terrae TaxID=2923278 RepID=A0A9X1VTS4_9BURK|nr:VOC family protein [Variovorax terrae]MCJ0763152.1 glyoxalase [Variovorax terrae]
MSIHAISHVQLAFPAGEEAEVRRFYGTLVGLTELRQPAAGTLRFVAGRQRVDLIPTENWRPPPAVSHLAFEVQDLPQLRSRLLAAQLALEESRPLPGYLRFYVRDPAGNQLEFLEPDPFQVSTV